MSLIRAADPSPPEEEVRYVSTTATYALPVPISWAADTFGQTYKTGFGSVPFKVVMPLASGPYGAPPDFDWNRRNMRTRTSGLDVRPSPSNDT